MAGDWIKMRIDLQTHPKVFRMVSALKADRLRIIGGLHVAWSIFDTHSDDGVLHGYTIEAMDAVVGWTGFTQAMIDVEWASVQDDGSLVMPRFDEHNGASAKRRANDNERKRNDRKTNRVRKTSASDADSLRTREEKRREDINPLSAREAVDPRMPSEMTLDWHADQKLLKTYSVHSGVALDLFTEEARRAFTAHYEPRGQVNTQAEWVQMLVKWVLNDRNRAAASNVKQFPARQSTEPDFDSTDWARDLVVSP
ncbi:DnaT-like ssDNA-binding domain-containing protein [Pseudomonas savastanoi]|uniref:DnaT-like ssDNA-binding domain-containing protein n=1 Tax=Pseudomonas savastanoi TaxID=29438 RepID=UPI000F00239C|nr:DnaT-like ssDNA-binding domain-containing protein [Pseudomonas savastanoi]